MSTLFAAQFHGVFSVLLAEALGEIAWRAEAYLVGYFLYGLVGGG